MERGSGLYIFKKYAWAARDDDRRLLCREFLLNDALALLEVIGVYDARAADAYRVTESFEVDL
ncbi:hypothetical protein SDC9_179827 [bioreactor metagenome]|uniref:Uncharacterized protein n=1 Tax=bioreactor metagenome TaxID=1076179 RepID=A0A645H2X7_9ZZZZ